MNKGDKSNRVYLKALEQYNNGYIDKALNLCEKSISMNTKNSAAINLKGLLYYLNGDFIGCKKLWQMNYKSNKDEIAYKYLKDIEDDKVLLKFYTEAVAYIRKLNFKKAIEILEECKKSDFNYINVFNNLTKCYLKIGQNYKALEYNEKVLSRDKNNIDAKKLKKQLINIGIYKKSKSKKIVLYLSVSILFICIISGGIYYFKFKYKKNPQIKKTENTIVVNNSIKKPKPKNIINSKDKDKEKKDKETKKDIFDSNKIKNYIEKKNFNELYSIYIYWKSRKLSINDKALLIKAESLLKEEGIEYFYNEAMEYAKMKNYNRSNENLGKAYNFGNVNYLYSHILYLLGSNYEKNSDVANSIKYYEKYISIFPRDSYSEEVVYKLAVLYEKIDNKKSKYYANKIDNLYSDSMYNNSNIQRIINSD